jgi:hypothetical protein
LIQSGHLFGARPILRPEPLRRDAFGTERTGMRIDRRTIELRMVDKLQRRLGSPQELAQLTLAVLDGVGAHINSVELQEIEREQYRLALYPAVAAQELEHGRGENSELASMVGLGRKCNMARI